MPKTSDCHRCLMYSHDPHLVCAVHPSGVEGNICIDFRPNTNTQAEELWQPEGATYYNGELILQPPQRWTPQQQFELLDWHPMFTGFCPQCGAKYERDYTARVHWDCNICGWMDDTV
ncbi:hypothetical protein [Nostoc parmelioides]|nr:hypothetical protein [Nostoc parmelioides]MBD2255057.1 hypothetical protein [Nostoc parmelioides FACHB-3921]